MLLGKSLSIMLKDQLPCLYVRLHSNMPGTGVDCVLEEFCHVEPRVGKIPLEVPESPSS
jgi:hypothetical protein